MKKSTQDFLLVAGLFIGIVTILTGIWFSSLDFDKTTLSKLVFSYAFLLALLFLYVIIVAKKK